MPALGNLKWEKYAQNLASGMKQMQAHELAGFSASAGNASALAKKPPIRERVLELLQEKEMRQGITSPIPKLETKPGTNNLTPAARTLSEEWLVAQLMNNIQQAQINGKYREANEAIKMLGNYFGGIFDGKNPTDQTQKVTKPGDNTMNPAEDRGAALSRMVAAMQEPDPTPSETED